MTYTINSKVISRVPYRVAGKTIGYITHTRENRDPNNPLQSLAGRDWYLGTTASGELCGEGNDRAYIQKRIRERCS